MVRIYLPPDANCLLSVADHCLRSINYVNVIVADKQVHLQYLDMEAAIAHCTKGAGIWDWASNDQGAEPDVVMASCGDVPTMESLAATALLRQHLPDVKVRFVNVVDLFKLVPHTEHPHGMTDREFEALFTPDKPVVFNFHSYPWLIHRLTYRRPGQHNIHVRGYKEQGNINTPLELAIRNQTDRFSLAIDAIDRMPRFRVTGVQRSRGPAQPADRVQAARLRVRRRSAGHHRLEVAVLEAQHWTGETEERMKTPTQEKPVPARPKGSADLTKLIEQYGAVRSSSPERPMRSTNGTSSSTTSGNLTAVGARERFEAVARSVRDVLSQRWVRTEETYERENPKRVYYLSMEFLIGRSLANNVTNLLLDPVAERRGQARRTSIGYELLEQEPDAGLGNGGLGRLAACFLDSMATMQLPAMGYGLRYEYGIFKQTIQDGWQQEQPGQLAPAPGPLGSCAPGRDGRSQAELLLRGARRELAPGRSAGRPA